MILVVTLFLVGCSSTQNNNITHPDYSNSELNESTNDDNSTKNDDENENKSTIPSSHLRLFGFCSVGKT